MNIVSFHSTALGIPRVRWYGIEGDYNAMVMDLLGLSLEESFNRCGRKFSLKTVLMLSDQMVPISLFIPHISLSLSRLFLLLWLMELFSLTHDPPNKQTNTRTIFFTNFHFACHLNEHNMNHWLKMNSDTHNANTLQITTNDYNNNVETHLLKNDFIDTNKQRTNDSRFTHITI